MGLAYKAQGGTSLYGTQTSVSVTGLNIAVGDVIVVFASNMGTAGGPPTGISDSLGNTYNELSTIGDDGYASRAAWVVSGFANASASVTGTYSAPAGDRRITLKVVIFTPDSGDTVSLDFSGTRVITAWTDPPFDTSSGNVTDADAVGVASCQTDRTITPTALEIGGSAGTALSSTTGSVETWYRIFTSTQNDVYARLNRSGGVGDYSCYLLVLKSVASAGAVNVVYNII